MEWPDQVKQAVLRIAKLDEEKPELEVLDDTGKELLRRVVS